MVWRFSPLFLAAIVAVGLSSGSLSSAETEKKRDGMNSRLERIKRSILWKQEMLFSDEQDSTSSKKLAKHRRCRRGSGDCGNYGHFGKTRLSAFLPRLLPDKPRCEGLELRPPTQLGRRKGYTELVFDLGENMKVLQSLAVMDRAILEAQIKGTGDAGIARHVWNPYPREALTEENWPRPRPFIAKLFMTDFSRDMRSRGHYYFIGGEKALGGQVKFNFKPFVNRLEGGDESLLQKNENRFLVFPVVLTTSLKQALTLKIFEAPGKRSSAKLGKFVCQFKFGGQTNQA